LYWCEKIENNLIIVDNNSMDIQLIQSKIYNIRGMKVMLDFDLAEMYEVLTKNLNLAVKRNINRFPVDFMFQLSEYEWKSLRLQFATSNKRGGTRYLPYAFSEQGLAMLSSILTSEKAIEVNISIMRAFVFIRHYAMSHQDLTNKLKELETKYNHQFNDVFEALDYLLNKDKVEKIQKERKKIGF
jgi:hypothetical protein